MVESKSWGDLAYEAYLRKEKNKFQARLTALKKKAAKDPDINVKKIVRDISALVGRDIVNEKGNLRTDAFDQDSLKIFQTYLPKASKYKPNDYNIIWEQNQIKRKVNLAFEELLDDYYAYDEEGRAFDNSWIKNSKLSRHLERAMIHLGRALEDNRDSERLQEEAFSDLIIDTINKGRKKGFDQKDLDAQLVEGAKKFGYNLNDTVRRRKRK